MIDSDCTALTYIRKGFLTKKRTRFHLFYFIANLFFLFKKKLPKRKKKKKKAYQRIQNKNNQKKKKKILMVKSLGKKTHSMLIHFVICSLSTTVRPEVFFFSDPDGDYWIAAQSQAFFSHAKHACGNDDAN